MADIRIAALYRFARIAEPEAVRAAIEAACRAGGVRGTLLVAGEGVNGTIAGPPAGIDAVLDTIRAMPGLAELEVKFADAKSPPFQRLKVKVKPEIVTIGDPAVDPLKAAGTYVRPEDWNALIADPDVLLIDVRNDYEHRIGSFVGAVDPGTTSFRDFPAWVRERLAGERKRKVAMFCTGGIRCEKASAFMLQEGFAEVHHLKGGILSYLETVPAAESRWNGACFVFDERVAVGHGLVPEPRFAICHGCRRPLTEADRAQPAYEEGVSCPRCVEETTEAQRASARERQRQIRFARARGLSHLGPGGEGAEP